MSNSNNTDSIQSTKDVDVALIDEDDIQRNKENRSQAISNQINAKNRIMNGVLPLQININHNTSSSSSTNRNVAGMVLSNGFTYKTIEDIEDHLICLQDENAVYMNILHACHFLNRFCSHGSYNAIPFSSSSTNNPIRPNLVQSTVLHIQQYTNDMTKIMHALSNTITSHSDRRCRIIAIQTLTNLSIQTLPKLISITHNPHLYSNREDITYVSRLEDEITNDVIRLIVNHCILEEEEDEGVVCVAMECLGRFVIGDVFGHNDLTKEVLDLQGKMMCKSHHLVARRGLWDGYYDKTGGRTCGGSTSTNSYADEIQDVDYQVHRLDMQWKILESILGPRIRKFFIRVSLFQSRLHKVRSLTVLNEIMIFVYKTEKRRRNGGETGTGSEELGKDGFANRWYEFDSTMLIQEYVDVLVIPLLRQFEDFGGPSTNRSMTGATSNNGVETSLCVASNALMLCSTVGCKESWFEQLLHLSIQNLEYGFHATKKEIHSSVSIDTRLNLISLMIIAMRGMKCSARVSLLAMMVEFISALPSTHPIPKGCVSLAIKFDDGSQRMPSRIGYWTEIALTLLLPDRSTHMQSNNNLSSTAKALNSVKRFLASSAIQSLLSSRSNAKMYNAVLHPAEEFVYTICSVAHTIVEQTWDQIESTHKSGESESWLYVASSDILGALLPCMFWKSDKSENAQSQSEIVFSMCHACQRAYLELLKNVLLVSGLLSKSTSVFINLIGSGRLLSEDQPIDNYQQSRNMFIPIENKLTQFLEKLLTLMTERENDIHRNQRISILAILSDTWVEQSRRIIKYNNLSRLGMNQNAGPIDVDDVININEQRARELLSLLAMEISKLLDDEKNERSRSDDDYGTETRRYLMACISSVEIIGYTCRILLKFFSSDDELSNKENKETCRHMLSICTVVLKGQGRIEIEQDDKDEDESGSTDSPPRSPRSRARMTAFTTKCADAAERLQQFFNYNDDDQQLQDENIITRIFHVIKEMDFNNDLHNLCDSFSLINIDRKMKVKSSSQDILRLQHQFEDGTFCTGYFVLIFRQILSQKLTDAINTSDAFQDETNSNSMITSIADPLRISYPTAHLSSRKNEKLSQESQIILDSSKTHVLTSGSDPLAMTLTHSKRQWCTRFDGDAEWVFVVIIAIHNVTAVPILNGIRLDVSIAQNVENDVNQAIMTENCLYNNTLESGGHFFWEIVLDSWPLGGEIGITCTLRELEAENRTHVLFPFEKENVGDDENENNDNYIEEGNFEDDEILDVTFHGDSVSIPSLCLQPCPLTFYRDDCGDDIVFQFLWLSMPFRKKITLDDSNQVKNVGVDNKILARHCMLALNDNGDDQIRKWAFSTWHGKSILVMISTQNDNELLVRGNDEGLLELHENRSSFLTSLFSL